MSSPTTRLPGEGEELRAGPTVSVVKVPGTANDGQLGVVEMRLDAGWEGPPLHVHKHVHHIWYVLEGDVMFNVAGQSDRYPKGSCLYVPAAVPHGFSTRGGGSATVLQVDTPRSLDGYFRDLAQSFPPGQPVDPAAVAAVMRRHDTYPVK